MNRRGSTGRKRSHKGGGAEECKILRAILLAPSFDVFGPSEKLNWHARNVSRTVGPSVPMSEASARCAKGEPVLIRTATTHGDDRKGVVCPPTERKGTEVWFIHKRHRIVFVIDTSPSMRTLRGSSVAPPLSSVGAALGDCFLGLARPMGSLHQEVFVTVVAHVHTEVHSPRGNDARHGRDSVVNLVQGFLLHGRDRESARVAAEKLSKIVATALGKLEASLWALISAGKKCGVSATAAEEEAPRAAAPGSAFVVAPPSSLEPMIEAGVFALKWMPHDSLPAIVLVTDGVCRDKQLLTTYDGMIMQLCRRDITLHVLQLGVEAPGSSALGMVPDTDTIGRLCEMTGGTLYNPKLLASLIRIPATLLHAPAGSSDGGGSFGSSGGGSLGRLSSGGGGSFGSAGMKRQASFGALTSSHGGGFGSIGGGLDQTTGLFPSAFQQAILFRLSPLSGVEDQILDARSPLLQADHGIRVLLGRKVADRYRLPRVLIQRLVDMRNSEGFKLVEARFHGDRRELGNTGDTRGLHNTKVTFTWSMRWQTDVLLKYVVDFSPATPTVVHSSTGTTVSTSSSPSRPIGRSTTRTNGVTLGSAEVSVDIVCSADFMAKIGQRLGSSPGESERPRDRIFNDPAAQLRHFVRVLRDVDHMLVQVCGLIDPSLSASTFAAPVATLPSGGGALQSSSLPASSSPLRSRSAAMFSQGGPLRGLAHNSGYPAAAAAAAAAAARYKILGKLSVRDWQRWFQVLYFEVKCKGALQGIKSNKVATEVAPSDRVAARAQLMGALKRWCHREKNGRVLSSQLYLRLMDESTSSSAEPLGFCLVKLNWDPKGGFASFHMGFFNSDSATRQLISKELHGSLNLQAGPEGRRRQNRSIFEVTLRETAAKMVRRILPVLPSSFLLLIQFFFFW